MSGPDHGDEDKGFLARWSQRKQEAKQPEPERDEPTAAAEIPPAPVEEAAPEFDLSSLPKLEEMTGATDITGFLQKGVPEHLRNAALRKSWALDPAIRNYVNPALEYAYDWNVPGGVPGTSEIGAGMDVARMVLQIMGDSAPAESLAADSARQPADDSALTAEDYAAREAEPARPLPATALRLGDEGISTAQDSTAQDMSAETRPTEDSSVAPQPAVRRHGSAKPIV